MDIVCVAQCCVCSVHCNADYKVLKFIDFVVCICVHNVHCCLDFFSSYVFFVCILQCPIPIHELQHSKLLHHNLVCIVQCPSLVCVCLLEIPIVCISWESKFVIIVHPLCASNGIQCAMAM